MVITNSKSMDQPDIVANPDVVCMIIKYNMYGHHI